MGLYDAVSLLHTRAGTGFITDSEMFERLAVLGFDTQGVEELFAAITGSRKGAISREAVCQPVFVTQCASMLLSLLLRRRKTP